MEYKTVVVDINSIACKLYHASGGGVRGILEKTFKTVNSLYQKYNPEYLIMASDSYANIRKVFWKDYKANRRGKVSNGFYIQIEDLKNWLNKFGVSIFSQNGYEADDIIAVLTRNKKLFPILIVSNDSDLYQLVNDKVHVLNGQIITPTTIKQKYGFPASFFCLYRIVAGCASDNVKGLLSPIETIKLFERFNYDKEAIIAEAKRIDFEHYNRNELLVSLPFHGVEIDTSNVSKINWNENKDKIIEFLSLYNINIPISKVLKSAKKRLDRKQKK